MEGTRIFLSHEAALFCGSSGLANLADGRVDDGVEKLIVIGFGLRLDVIADLLACGFALGQRQVAVLSGDGG